jgi:hypothetical protein
LYLIATILSNVAAGAVAGATNSLVGEIETAISIDPATQNPSSISSTASTFLGVRDETVTTQSFTQFRSETDTIEAIVNTTLPDTVSDNRFDAKRILGNPRILKQGSLSYEYQISPYNSFDFGYTFFNKTPVKDIVKNFVGMTFTMCVDVKISTDPYQSGMYYLVFIPPGYSKRTRIFDTDTTTNTHLKVMTCCEFLPHVEIDIQENPTGLLKVKFYFPVNYYEVPTLAKANTLGQFALLSSVAGSQVTGTPEFTMLGWLEDIEFRFPGDSDTVTPALSRTKRVVPDSISEVEIPKPISSIPSYIRAQPQGPELKPHIIGKSLVTQVRSEMTTPFNLIDDLQGPPGGAYPYAPKPSLVCPDGSASDSFSDLYQQRSFLGVISWPKTATSGAYLGKIAVCPSPKVTPADTITPQTGFETSYNGNFTRTALSTEFFNLVTGTLHFRIKIPKTLFHSGKIQIAYLPGMNHNVTAIDWSKHWNTIINVKESSDFTIEIPGTPSTYNYYKDSIWGYLVFRVLNKIICPTNVVQNLALLLYVHGDLQTRSPCYSANAGIPINVAAPTSIRAQAQGPVFSAPKLPVPSVPLTPSNKISNFAKMEGPYASGPAKMTRVIVESLRARPQISITDGPVSSPNFTSNNDSLSISEFLGRCPLGGLAIDNQKTVAFPADATEARYMQSLSPSFIYSGVGERNATNTFCLNRPINRLVTIFQGVRCDIYYGDMTVDVSNSPLNSFLVNNYNYGAYEFNPQVTTGTTKNIFVTAPYDSNLIYGPYLFRDVLPGKAFRTTSGCLLNFQGFYPWYPSCTSLRNT